MDNSFLHETKVHGTVDFPYIVYHGKIPDFIDAYPLHWHDEAELIYVTKGQVCITVWSDTYVVQSGDLIILMPHTIHSIEQFETCDAEYFNIVFHFSILYHSDEDSCYTKYLKPFLTHEKTVNCYEKQGTALNTQLTPLLLTLIKNRQNSYTTHELLVKANLFLIMHYLNQFSTPAKAPIPYTKLKAALYYVQTSYAQTITIAKAASLCGFSESHFMKLFKELTGMSFTSYLVHYRLELAAKQLLETNQKVIEIAANCGFHNFSYFTRAFVQKYHITPGKYRKRMPENTKSHPK